MNHGHGTTKKQNVTIAPHIASQRRQFLRAYEDTTARRRPPKTKPTSGETSRLVTPRYKMLKEVDRAGGADGLPSGSRSAKRTSIEQLPATAQPGRKAVRASVAA